MSTTIDQNKKSQIKLGKIRYNSMICFANIQNITTLMVVTITKSYSINLVSD